MTSDQNPASRRPSGAAAEPGPALRYLCFGGGGQVYLVHQVQLSPSFDQVLAVRLAPGTMRTLVGHLLGDDVAAIGLGQAQPAEVGRDDVAERRGGCHGRLRADSLPQLLPRLHRPGGGRARALPADKRAQLTETANRKERIMALEPGDHVWYWNGNISQATNIPQSDWFPGFSGPTDYLGHGEEIYNFVVYDDEVVRGQPHMRNHPGTYAWLNNNPGNITGTAGGPDYGQYPGKFNWHNFLIFPTWDVGFGAIALLLRGPSYVNRTILEAFQHYAPASDGNDPVRYAQDVADALGLPTSTTIYKLDDEQVAVMQEKIAEIEGAVAGDSFAYDSPDLPPELTDLLP